MLTDDEIKAIIEGCDKDSWLLEVLTRLLSAEARVKVLEEALRPFADAIWVWSDDYALQTDGIEREELSRARTALQEQA